MGSHVLVVIPRLRLEHDAVMRLAEGASLLSLFHESLCDLDGKARPTSVLSGQFELFTLSTPTLGGVICFVRGTGEPPGLGVILREGVAILRGE